MTIIEYVITKNLQAVAADGIVFRLAANRLKRQCSRHFMTFMDSLNRVLTCTERFAGMAKLSFRGGSRVRHQHTPPPQRIRRERAAGKDKIRNTGYLKKRGRYSAGRIIQPTYPIAYLPT